MKFNNSIFFVLCTLIVISCTNRKKEAWLSNEASVVQSIDELNQREIDRGDGFKSDARYEYATTRNDQENYDRYQRLKNQIDKIAEVDSITAKIIQQIDQLKIKILTDLQENIHFNRHRNDHYIIWSKPDYAHLNPLILNYKAILSRGKPVDFSQFKTDFDLLYKNCNHFRAQIVSKVGSYSDHGKNYTIQPESINNFKNQQDLEQQIQKMIQNSKANLLHDEKTLLEIYAILTLKEKNENKQYWAENNFENTPVITILKRLSMLQNKILIARKMAVKSISNDKNRWNSELIFNQANVVVSGPDVAKRNEQIELKIVVAAFEETGFQLVKANKGTVWVENGISTVKLKAQGKQEMIVKGTVSSKTNSGVMKVNHWEKIVKITD